MTAAPEFVTDSTEVLGLLTAALALASLLVGLLWKAFRIHDLVIDTANELKPDHGGSLRDQVDATRTLTEANAQSIEALTQHTAQAIEQVAERARHYDEQNEQAHAQLHRRIDGLFELIAGPGANTARRLADQHRRAHREDPT